MNTILGHTKATTLGNGKRQRQRWWPMEMATAIANSDEDSNGWQWGWGQQQWLTVTQKRRRWWWVMATATAMADGNGNGSRLRQCWQQRQRRQRWRRQWRWRWQLQSQQPQQRQPIIKEGLHLHVPAMCSAVAGATPCLHPHGTQRKVLSPAFCHGGHTAKSVWSLSRGRVPDSSPWIVILFIFYSYCSVYLTTLCSSSAFFRCSRTLSAYWCSTSSIPPRSPSAYWWSTPATIALMCWGKPGQGLQWL